MKINFKQPKYILPLSLLPFLCLFFFVYHSSFAAKKKDTKQEAGINGTVGDVSPEVRKKQLEDKMDAYRNSYKDAAGYSAVSAFPEEIYTAPESWARNAYPRLIHFNRLPKGGHFAAWEQPQLMAEELRSTFRSLRVG